MNDEITKAQIEILKHANKPESRGQFVGCVPGMERLVDIGMMRFIGKPSWCPDQFYAITRTGIDFLKTFENNDTTSTQNTDTRYPIGTLDDAQESVIKIASENAKLRAKAEKYDQLIKDLGV